jgi:predicted site-specific integrase-resolvase
MGTFVKLEFDSSAHLSSTTNRDSTEDDSCGIDSIHMTPAALYARVSSDAQKQEGTITSQVAELKRQIAAAGHVHQGVH